MVLLHFLKYLFYFLNSLNMMVWLNVSLNSLWQDSPESKVNPEATAPQHVEFKVELNGILNAIRIYLSIKFRACWPFNCRIGHFWVPTWIPGFPASKRWLLEAAKQIRKLCTKHTYKTTFVQNTCDFTCPTFLHLK